MRYACALALSLFAASPAAATDFITYTDTAPNGSAGILINDIGINHALAWTQTIATFNTSIGASITSTVGNGTSGNWYVTRAIGAGATAADVVASGSYSPPTFTSAERANLNIAPRTTFTTGLDLAAGTYYLVMDGPVGFNGAGYFLTGDDTVTPSLSATGGFSYGGVFTATTRGGVPLPAFAPAGAFEARQDDAQYGFFISGDLTAPAVPEPSSWAMMIVGFGIVGAGVRRRRAVAATVRPA